MLKEFWYRSKGKICFISHKVLFRCEEFFKNWSTVLYRTSKLNKVQLCIEHVTYNHLVNAEGVTDIPLPRL